MDFPRILLVRQHFPDRSLPDIPGAVRSELHRASLGAGLKPGSSIAIGVGSRGIANIAVITRAVVDYWKSVGMKPFIFPAMGSHGAATAEGQARVLAHFGIRESSMECPIRSQLDVVPAGRTAEGIDTYIDRLAWESDGIMVVGRVKWHTDFEGEIESGLFKMMAIGLGKFAGAEKYHTHAYKLGLEHVILSVGRRILSTGKVLGGLAVLEDAYHQTAQVTAAGAEEMEQRERELLALTKSWMGRIPVAELDILVVDELGKNISGAGMDTKVVNRIGEGPANSWPLAPKIERIFVRGISELSHGGRRNRPFRSGHRLDPDHRQRAHCLQLLHDAYAGALRRRPRVSGAAVPHRRQVRSTGGDSRLDPEHARARPPGAQREPAPRD